MIREILFAHAVGPKPSQYIPAEAVTDGVFRLEQGFVSFAIDGLKYRVPYSNVVQIVYQPA